MAINYAQSPPVDTLEVESREPETMMSLLRKLMDEVSTLFRQEMALASAEFSRSLTKLLAGAASVATGGAVLFAGFLVLLSSAVLGLSNVMDPWLAALLVGLAVAIIGGVMVATGMKALKASNLKPKHSPNSIKQDKEVLMRQDS